MNKTCPPQPFAVRPMALEQRFMFDGAAASDADPLAAERIVPPAVLADSGLLAAAAAARPVTSLVFVDAKVRDAGTLLQGIDPGAEVVYLQAGRSGLDQMAEHLAQRSGLASIVIVGEGAQANLWLGNDFLTQDSLPLYRDDLAKMGQALQPGGDLLVYSCNLAAGDAGLQFVQALSALTGADVAASNDRTGAGGDWELEITSGTVTTASPLSAAAQAAYGYDLATFTVTSNADTGAGTLRQAITDAQSGDTITFNTSMTIALTSGQLEIAKNLTIDGDLNNDGTADVTLDAGYRSRVLQISSGNVTLDGLTLTRGLVSGNGGGYGSLNGGDALGAGIWLSGGTLTLKHSSLTANAAAGGGGGGGGGFYGGGGGGGAGGQGGGSGGAGSYMGYSYSGSAGGSGHGGDGGGYGNVNQVGKGGSTAGGFGGGSGGGAFGQGGGGGAATSGSLSIGGGGGGAGSGSGNGGSGGRAVAGLYIGAGATAYVSSTSFSGNAAAGGGGGGSKSGAAGSGGLGVGSILTAGTLKYQSSTVTLSSAGTGGGGGGTQSGTAGSAGASVAGAGLIGSGSIDSTWAPATAATVTDANISISGASGTGGAYKIGDTVTATWNNTAGGDNNSGVTGVTVNFSQFGGGSAVAASNSSGTWTATYTIVAGSVDTTARNVSVSATNSIGTTTTADTTNATVDNVAPTVTDARISISGASGTGGAFKIGDTVTATWNNTAGGDNNSDTISSATVDFSAFGGGSAVAASNSSGTWTATYTIVSGAIDGTNKNISVTATDNAGNTTTMADTTNATVDNVAPTTTIATVGLSNDNGVSGTDFITNTPSQTISGTLSANVASGEVVYVSLDNGSIWTAATTTVGANTWSLSGQTLVGSNTLKIKVADAVGNDGTVSSQAYTLDATAPAAPSTPNMTNASDTGTSNTDDITRNTTPVFTGTAEVNSTVTLYDTDGTTVLGTATATGGNWSITSSAMSAGSHTLTAKATDVAGNTSVASSGLSVTVDTTAPSGVILDTTTIVTSNATSNSNIATLSATDALSTTYSLATGNGFNDADNGTFAISGTSLKVGGASLSAGTYKIYVAATDAAGNVANQAFTITVVDAPTVSSVVRTGGAFAGVSANATSVSYTVTFSQSVTGVDASDFILTSTGTASGSIANVSGSGTTYTVTVDTLSGDGTLRLDLNGSGTGIQNGSSVDIASGFTSGQTYTLDHTAPSAPSAPDMTSATDTGSSSTDNITSNTTPVFNGTAESGSTVTLYDNDGSTVLGTATATGGNWSITSSALSAGSHTLTAKATDASGNLGAASSALSINLDTAAPTAVALSSTSVADTAATSGATVATLSATDENSVSYALVTGNGTNDANNASFTISGGNLQAAGNLTAGNYSILVRATDAAGNTSDQAFTIMVTAGPSVTSINRSVGTSLTNASSVNFTVTFSESVTGVDTSDFNLTTTGTASGSISSVSGSGSTYTVTVNTLSGDGTLRLDLNNAGTGIVNVRPQAITGGYTSGQTYTLDTTAPVVPTGLDMTAASDSGNSRTDNITSVTTPTITGSGAEAGATVTLYDTNGTTVLGTATADGSGNWSINSSTLGGGAHMLTAKVTDAAGNTSAASAGLTVTVDTTVPSAVALSVNSVMDVATGTNTAVATLSATDTQVVSYALVGGDGTNDADNGSFLIVGGTLQSRSQLTAGTYNIRVGATDAAGNVSYQTFAITVNANTAPTITSGTTATVAENAPMTTVVYTATATDVDASQTLSYSLSGTDAGSFDINASTGVVTLKASANYETKNSYSFNVLATDNGTPNRASTRAVTLTVTDVNDAPTGSLTINGTVKQGETLTVTDTLADEDGINGQPYQWYADGQPITGANLSTFTLGEAQVGKIITVKASYTDGVGRQEVVSSAATVAVVNVNDPTTGEVTVGGQSGVGQTLTATNTLADLDGMGAVTYQWQYKDTSGQWHNITLTNGQLATGASYTVEPQHALQELRVKASYTDGQGTSEVVYSTASIKAGGLPPVQVPPLAPPGPPLVSTPVVALEAAQPPTSVFISRPTSNALPVLGTEGLALSNPGGPAQSDATTSSVIPSINALTRGDGGHFPVSVTTSVGGNSLLLNRGMSDQAIGINGRAEISVPSDAFAHTDPNAVVQLSAQQANGQPLPNWVRFDAAKGTFVLNVPPGVTGEISIKLVARDSAGHEVATVFKIRVPGKRAALGSVVTPELVNAMDAPVKLGKLSLAEQIRLSDKSAGTLAELAALSQAFAASGGERSHT